MEIICAHCAKTFEKRPNCYRQKFCSPKCRYADQYIRTRDVWLARNKRWVLNNQGKRDAYDRARRRTEKSREAVRRSSKKGGAAQKYMERYRADPTVRALQSARWRSRRILKNSGIEYICGLCNTLGEFGRLHCHHRDENPFNISIENLQWLCPSCHGIVHSKAFIRKQVIIPVCPYAPAEGFEK